MKKLTTKDFIKKAKEKHGDKYDYSLVKYKNAKTKIKIICPEHGVFEQYSHNHFKHGCQKCANQNQKYNQKSTKEFIKNAKEIHGDKYDYSLVKYKNAHIKVKIICPTHGEFEQKPNNHLQGQGCLKCNYEEKTKSFEKFLLKAKEIHGNKYDYSLIDKNNIKHISYVKIICSIHGVFIQKISSHLSGHGCQKCAYERNQIDNDIFIKWQDYKNLIRNKTKTLKTILLKTWNGYDYYDGEYIKDNFNLKKTDKNYPNIDHKISIFEGFKNNISISKIASLDNLCITKRYHNLKKRTFSDIDYKKYLEKNEKI